jgi:hypothetical protein
MISSTRTDSAHRSNTGQEPSRDAINDSMEGSCNIVNVNESNMKIWLGGDFDGIGDAATGLHNILP